MKLSNRQKTALRDSIKKWESIVNKSGEDEGWWNCACCINYRDFGCRSCPVFLYSNTTGCVDTPYEDWEEHQLLEHDKAIAPYRVECEECKEIAQRELDFLKSLLEDK